MGDRGKRLAAFGFAVTGYLVTAVMLVWLWQQGRFDIAPSDMDVWDRVGDQVRAGISPYAQAGPDGFFYAPPWALALALVTWLPPLVVAGGIVAAEVAALYYIAGSWTRVGWLCLCPLVALELVQVQVNLLMAAAVLAAVRGKTLPAVFMGLAKLSPFLVIRQWRAALFWTALIVLLTPGMWFDWAAQLYRSVGTDIAPGAQWNIPFLPRLAVALALAATNRPSLRIVAAVIATPALYKITLVGLIALLPRDQPVPHPLLRRVRAAGATPVE